MISDASLEDYRNIEVGRREFQDNVISIQIKSVCSFGELYTCACMVYAGTQVWLGGGEGIKGGFWMWGSVEIGHGVPGQWVDRKGLDLRVRGTWRGGRWVEGYTKGSWDRMCACRHTDLKYFQYNINLSTIY